MSEEVNKTNTKQSLSRIVKNFYTKFKDYDANGKPYSFDIKGQYNDGTKFTFIAKGTGAEKFNDIMSNIVEDTLDVIDFVEYPDKYGKKPGETVSIKLTDKPDRDIVIMDRFNQLDEKISKANQGGLSGPGLGAIEKEMLDMKHNYAVEKLQDKNRELSEKLSKLQNEFDELEEDYDELEEENEKLQEIKEKIDKSGENGAMHAAYLSGFIKSPIGKGLADKFVPGLSGIIEAQGGNELTGGASPMEQAIEKINSYMRSLSEENFRKLGEILQYCAVSEENLNNLRGLIN
jgi:hypothetical protein